MRGRDVNKCDSESRKINLTALLSVPLSFKWRTHSSHAPCWRLPGMLIVVGTGLRDVVPVCDCVQQRSLREKKGTPATYTALQMGLTFCYPKLAEPLLTAGDKRLEKKKKKMIAAAHRLPFCRPNEKPRCQQAAPSHCCRRNGGTER